MYSEIFTQFILGQKVTGFGWIQPCTENNYVGGYATYFENGYKTVVRGGGRSGEDYTEFFILDKDNVIIESYEQCVY